MVLDFFVGTGDNVYYDGRDINAKTQEELRRKWQEQFVQERFVRLFRNVPSYWEKTTTTIGTTATEPATGLLATNWGSQRS